MKKIEYYDGFKTEDIENDPIFDNTLLKARYELHLAWSKLASEIKKSIKQSWVGKMIKLV